MTLPPPAGIVPLPDSVAVICAHLTASLDGKGVTVGTRLPDGYDGSQLVVRVDRIGGAMDPSAWAWLDNAHLDVEAWAPIEEGAYDLIAAVRVALILAPYTDLSAQGAVISKVDEQVGPQWFPDPDYPGAGHQLLQVLVTLHPTPPAP